MGSKPHQLHIFFFPMLAHGHMIPMVDIARLFSLRGVKATIIMTPLNASHFSKTIHRDIQNGIEISIRVIEFPSAKAGLPEACENVASLTSQEMVPTFYNALDLLQPALEQLLEEDRPDCLIADMFFPWATEIAAKLGIPRLIFHGFGFFTHCVNQILNQYKPYEHIESDSEPFILPELPDRIQLTRQELPTLTATSLFQKINEAEKTSYGVLVNSFRELEPAYSNYFRKVMGRKAWHIGPVSLCNRDYEDKSQRGNGNSNYEECLSWLNSKKPNSVLYVCFGSVSNFSASQQHEIAMGLEASGQQFIWVMRKKQTNDEDEEKLLPEGFEKRMEGKGMIIRGWAPQVLILDHESIGGFVTHCGWNSLLEAVTAGVPMVTWPLFADQFYNEKLVTDVLKIGVRGGAHEWCRWAKDDKVSVKREDVEKAVSQVMVGEEAGEMRSRARGFKDMARKAVEEGGSSYSDLNALLEELKSNQSKAC